MPVYAFWNNKGGVGKSYLTFQVARMSMPVRTPNRRFSSLTSARKQTVPACYSVE